MRGEEPDRIIRDSLNGKVGFDLFNEAWDQRIDASLEKEIPVEYGALKLVQTLAKKGHSLAVATSTSTERACLQLKKSGLFKHFNCVIGGDMVSKHKPDPEVYYKAANQLGYRTSNCVAFEDSEMGTRAAVASGATTIQVPDLLPPSDALKELGHQIAPDLLKGAITVGLIAVRDVA